MFRKLVAYLVIFSIFMIDIATAMRKTLSSEDLQAKEARRTSKPPSRRASFSGTQHKKGFSFVDSHLAMETNGLPTLLPTLLDTETAEDPFTSANTSPLKGSNNPSSNETSLIEDQKGLKSSSSDESLSRHSHSVSSENEKDDQIPSSPDTRNSSPVSDKTLEEFETKEKFKEALLKREKIDEVQVQESAINGPSTSDLATQTVSDQILPLDFNYKDFLTLLPKKKEAEVDLTTRILQQEEKDNQLISLNLKHQGISSQSTHSGETKKKEERTSVLQLSSPQLLNGQPTKLTKEREEVQEAVQFILAQDIKRQDEKKNLTHNTALAPLEDKKDKDTLNQTETLFLKLSNEEGQSRTRSSSSEELDSNTQGSKQGSPLSSPLVGSPKTPPILGESEGRPNQWDRDSKTISQTGSLNNSPKTEDEIVLLSSNSESVEEIQFVIPQPNKSPKDKALQNPLTVTRGSNIFSEAYRDEHLAKNDTEKYTEELLAERIKTGTMPPFPALPDLGQKVVSVQLDIDLRTGEWGQIKRINYDTSEKDPLLPQKGSIQTYDTYDVLKEEGFEWVMDTKEGSFTTKSSEPRAWYNNIPVLSWIKAHVGKNQTLEKKSKGKDGKGSTDLIIDPSEKEDESIPTTHLKGNEVLSRPSLKSDLGEDKEKELLLPVSQPIIAKKGDKPLVIYGTGGEDPEDGKNGMILVLPEDLDPRVKAFLIYAKDYINDGKITLRQGLLGGIGGTLIGVGVGNAMPPILDAGLDGLGSKFHHEINLDENVANFFTVHTAVTLGIDSISRNAIIIGKLASPSIEEFSILEKNLKFKKNSNKTA